MSKRAFKIESVFSKFLGVEARKLAAAGTLKIIPVADFPAGAPLHEDGTSVYDPRKPLNAWAKVCREFDRMRAGL